MARGANCHADTIDKLSNVDTYARQNTTMYNDTNVYNSLFKKWCLGTVNIRSGKEKDEGAKLYLVAKEVARAGISICCLQEVKYRNSGSRTIELDTGEKYEFFWCGMKKRRTAGVGFLIRKDDNIKFHDPDILNPRVIAMNIKIHGFNIRLVNAYSPTESDSSESKKDDFYNQLKKACVKKEKRQKLIVAGDFNAKTGLAMKIAVMMVQTSYKMMTATRTEHS